MVPMMAPCGERCSEEDGWTASDDEAAVGGEVPAGVLLVCPAKGCTEWGCGRAIPGMAMAPLACQEPDEGVPYVIGEASDLTSFQLGME